MNFDEIGQEVTLTPLMRQYFEIKNKFPEALVFFQVGDFYELFFEDAQKASSFLGLVLTKRGTIGDKPIPLCGVPVHSVEHHVLKLIRGGFRVVFCDQLTKPQPGKLVERGVRYVLTPGTLTQATMLNEKSASYCAAIFPVLNQIRDHTCDQINYGLVFTELLTGYVYVSFLSTQDERLLEAELARFMPDEIVVPATKLGEKLELFLSKRSYTVTKINFLETIQKQKNNSFENWLKEKTTESVQSFLGVFGTACQALELMYEYLDKNFNSALAQCSQIMCYRPEEYLLLDAATQRNLELIHNTHDGSSAHTLFSLLDKSVTPMGSRQIKKWLLRPLMRRDQIEQRYDVISIFLHNKLIFDELVSMLKTIGDVERVVGRIVLSRAQHSDYTSLITALAVLPRVCLLLAQLISLQSTHLLELIKTRCEEFDELCEILTQALSCDAEKNMRIKPGFDSELDRLRSCIEEMTRELLELEKREQDATGISTLKVRYHNTYGYAIEVTKTHMDSVPSHYMRLQTLTNRERLTTQELKDLEYEIQQINTRITEREDSIYQNMCERVATYGPALKKCTQALAHLDALMGFAHCASEYGYIRPNYSNNSANNSGLIIKDGRHPVVEQAIQPESFIPNDTALIQDDRLWIITGPNMGGKSTYLRQVALIIIMAQAGAYVPAAQADLCIIDRIFTRIGSADHVSAGKSTFLVEMEETALICTHATKNSLVILDEVGRGTSSRDGVALAYAIVEYIYEHIQARCLFATHYHELTQLERTHAGISAYHTVSTQTADGVILLHKIARGSARQSFGFEVARRAGLPENIITRAQSLVSEQS